MLDTLELRFNVLLRDLEKSKHTVICFLGDHVQDVPEALRASLAPCLVHPEGHVLSAFLPTEKLNISLALVQTFGIIKAWPWEDSHDLSKLHGALGQGCHTMFQVLEWLLIDLGVQNI